MLPLVRAELARFRWHAMTVAVLLFGFLIFFDRVMDLLQQPKASYQLAGAIYMLIGVALGIYQAGSYSRPSPWVMLMHRPVRPSRIAGALAIGAGGILAVALALPALLLLVAHGLAGQIVDARHWLLPVAGWLIGMTGYLAGVIAILAPRRYGWLALIPAFTIAFASATGAGALVVQCAVVVVLATGLLALFRADRDAAPTGVRAAVLVALVSLGAYAGLTVIGDFAFQTVWIATGTHPLNSTPSRGGIVEAERSEGDALLDRGLAVSRDPQAALWREQARLSEIVTVTPGFERMPTRGELTNLAPMRFDDDENRVRWTFSHDDMRFHGTRTDDNRGVGLLGVGDTGRPFPAPPLAAEGGLLISAESIDRFDPIDRRVYRRIHVPRGETIAAAPEPAGDSVALLSDHALRLYDARALDQGDRLYPAFATVPLPAPVGSLMRIDLMELMDGYLLSFTYGRGAVSGPGDAWQSVVTLDQHGAMREISRRAVGADFPTAARYAGFWVSPFLERVQSTALGLFAGRAPLLDTSPVRVPQSMVLLAALLSLIAAIATASLALRRGLSLAAAAAWGAVALLAGVPVAIAFWLVAPRNRAS